MKPHLDDAAVARVIADIGKTRLGDSRRTARAQKAMARLAVAPDDSLPDAMGTDAELLGLYRLLNNEEVSFADLLGGHIESTVERARAQGLLLAIHDTTQCHYEHADPREIGYLNTGKAGFRLHVTLLASERDWKRPFGIVHAETLTREKPPRKRGTKHRKSGYETARQPDREFQRWSRGVAATRARTKGLELVHVADREADSFELMSEMIAAGDRFIIRSRQDRALISDDEATKLHDFVESAEVVLERSVPLSRRVASSAPRSKRVYPPRETRTATLRFATTTVTLKRPTSAAKNLPKGLTLNVLHVYEVNAPDGEEPVEWLLYTTESLDAPNLVERVIDAYRCRWLIEELNKALKTGCVVQERQLETYDALCNVLALSLPIAVELLAMRWLCQTDADAPATEVLGEAELAALRHASSRPLPPNPTVNDALMCIASMGGHLKRNGYPGWRVLQRGFEKFRLFAQGWVAAKAANL